MLEMKPMELTMISLITNCYILSQESIKWSNRGELISWSELLSHSIITDYDVVSKIEIRWIMPMIPFQICLWSPWPLIILLEMKAMELTIVSLITKSCILLQESIKWSNRGELISRSELLSHSIFTEYDLPSKIGNRWKITMIPLTTSNRCLNESIKWSNWRDVI